MDQRSMTTVAEHNHWKLAMARANTGIAVTAIEQS